MTYRRNIYSTPYRDLTRWERIRQRLGNAAAKVLLVVAVGCVLLLIGLVSALPYLFVLVGAKLMGLF